MITNNKVSLIKTGKANKPLKQETKREHQSKIQKCKVPEISAPKIFPKHPVPPTPLEMKRMTKIPRYSSQSRESLLDRAYEEISDKNSSMENMQIDPMVGVNIELQMSKEEFEKFMKIPIGNDEIKKTETLNPDQSKQT